MWWPALHQATSIDQLSGWRATAEHVPPFSCYATLTPSLSFNATTAPLETAPQAPQYGGRFDASGKVETCALAPPFFASRHCAVDFNGTEPVLAFGETNEVHGFRCVSAENGITCTKAAGVGAGNGFRINAHEVVRVGSASAGSSPMPAFDRTATVRTVSGTVLVRIPGGASFTTLGALRSVPMGTTIDTTNGTVALRTASDTAGQIERGQFYGGIFRIAQARAPSPVRGGRRVAITSLTLSGPMTECAASAASRGHQAAAGRRLWGNAHGNFQTRGRYASATVRGTEWLTEDTCAGTLVKVGRGVVAVEDLRTHRTTLVRSGHTSLMRAAASAAIRAFGGRPQLAKCSAGLSEATRGVCGVDRGPTDAGGSPRESG